MFHLPTFQLMSTCLEIEQNTKWQLLQNNNEKEL